MDLNKKHNIRKCHIFKTLAIFFLIIFVSTCIARWYNIKLFEDDCKVYIDRVSETSDVSTARVELKKAIDYIERKRLTFGIVSIAFNSPKNDLEFWYKSLKNIYDELDDFPANSTITEKSIFMVMIHETISNLSFPSGIELYPYNVVYFWLIVLSLTGSIAFFILFFKAKLKGVV